LAANDLLKEQLATAQKALQDQLDEIKNRMTDAESAIKILENKSLDEEAKRKALAEIVQKEKERTNKLEERMNSYDEQLNNLEEKLNSHQNQINSLFTQHEELAKIVAEHEQKIAQNEAETQQLKSELQANKNDFSKLLRYTQLKIERTQLEKELAQRLGIPLTEPKKEPKSKGKTQATDKHPELFNTSKQSLKGLPITPAGAKRLYPELFKLPREERDQILREKYGYEIIYDKNWPSGEFFPANYEEIGSEKEKEELIDRLLNKTNYSAEGIQQKAQLVELFKSNTQVLQEVAKELNLAETFEIKEELVSPKKVATQQSTNPNSSFSPPRATQNSVFPLFLIIFVIFLIVSAVPKSNNNSLPDSSFSSELEEEQAKQKRNSASFLFFLVVAGLFLYALFQTAGKKEAPLVLPVKDSPVLEEIKAEPTPTTTAPDLGNSKKEKRTISKNSG